MATPGTVIQELIPQLAASLGELRRAPGKSGTWAPQLIVTLQRERDPRYERMRRRMGFAQRLVTIAGIPTEEARILKLGIFFHELLPRSGSSQRASRPWRDYLLRNEGWLRPALDVCEAMRLREWNELEGDVEVVAKISAEFDNRTLEQHERPLVVIESIVAALNGTAMQHLVDLLWTEEGQALCDHHFRRHPRGYGLDPKEIAAGLAYLHRFAPRTTRELPLQALRSGGVSRQGLQEREVEAPVAVAAEFEPEPTPERELGHFDRRRAALRTRTFEAPAREKPAEPTIEPPALDERAVAEAPIAVAPRERYELYSDAAKPEDIMNQLASISPASQSRGDGLNVRERLQELQIQIGQIEQLAMQCEQLLAGIAPQIDDFAARIADVEAVMDRWNTRSRTAA